MRKTDYELLSDTELQRVLQRSVAHYDRASLTPVQFARLHIVRALRIAIRGTLRGGRELAEYGVWLASKAVARFASATPVERLVVAWLMPFLITLFVRFGLGFGGAATAGVWVTTFGAVLVFQHQYLSRRVAK